MQLHIIPKLTIFIGILGLVSIIILTQSNQDIRQQAKESENGGAQIERSDFKRGVVRDHTEQILEVTLHYQANAVHQLNILSSTIKEGFIPPFRKRKETTYSLLLLNKIGTVISSSPFEVTDEIEEMIPLPGDPVEGSPVKLTTFNFVVNIPWSSEATQIQITDTFGKVISAAPLGNLQVVPATKDYLTAQAETSTESNSFFGQVLNQVSGPPPRDYLDIVFVSNNYNTSADFEQYHQQVTQMSNYLLTYEPFKSQSQMIRFSSVDNFNDLNCVLTGRLIMCDVAKVLQALNTVGVPYDKVIVVDNTPLYGGSAGSIAVTYNGQYQNQVFVHEFGHILGLLGDEYVEKTVDNDPNAFVAPNCYRGTPPNPAWQGLVEPTDYFLGCNYPSWYRSSASSLMRDITSEYFNPVSQRGLARAMAFYVDPLSAAVCDADINQDKIVDLNDYTKFLANVLQTPPLLRRADINRDGKVDLTDYSLLYRSFLQRCP